MRQRAKAMTGLLSPACLEQFVGPKDGYDVVGLCPSSEIFRQEAA
jgi:hypothetical protein